MNIFTEHQIYELLRAVTAALEEKEFLLDWWDVAPSSFVDEIDTLKEKLPIPNNFEYDIQQAAQDLKDKYKLLVIPEDQSDIEYNSSIYNEIIGSFPNYLDKYIQC